MHSKLLMLESERVSVCVKLTVSILSQKSMSEVSLEKPFSVNLDLRD